MTTTYKELYSRVLLRLDTQDGRALLASKEAVNSAHRAIARVQDFEELVVLDTTSADTVASTKTYHLVDDLGLTNPKDIYYIKYMDEGSSRKLTYKTPRWVAENWPYEEIFGEQKPQYYTRRGKYIDIIPVPDEAKDLYIYYSQWPTTLSADTDQTSYEDIDDIIIDLAAEIAADILRSSHGQQYEVLAKQMLGISIREERHNPDADPVASPFNPQGDTVVGEYWKQPFVRRTP